MSKRITNIGPAIGPPTICLISLLFAEKARSFVSFFTSFLKINFLQSSISSFLT